MFANIVTSGIVAEGELIALGWPEPNEFDQITSLRNTTAVRRWFLDDRSLDPVRNREWLASGMRRPFEGLLSIRWRADDTFFGTIGWSDWNPTTRVAWLGRLAIDIEALRRNRSSFPRDYKGVVSDAGDTLADYVFGVMQVDIVMTYVFAQNKLARQVNRNCGLKETGRGWRTRPDGSDVETIEMKATRAEWEEFRRHQRERAQGANLLPAR